MQTELAGLEVRNLLAGRDCDSRVIDSPDQATRQVIAAELLAALLSQDFDERERARQLFIDHGYFDEATRSLKTAESPADRAAAARKLGMLGSQLATAHLIATIFDSDPEVRRAGAEALVQLSDPWVNTAPLNALLTGEMTRDVAEVPEPTRRVAENIDLDQTTFTQYAGEALWSTVRQTSVADPSRASDEAHLLTEEDALRKAPEEKQRRRLEAEAAAMGGADAEQLKRIEEAEADLRQAEAEAQQRAEVEQQLNAGIEALRKVEAEQLKRVEEAEADLRQAEAEAQQRAEAEQQLKAGIEALRKVEAKQLKRLEETEAGLRQVEAEAQQRAEA